MARSDPPAPLRTDDPRVARLRSLARLMDESITIPGTSYKIGLDPIIGLIPGIGDLIGAAVSLYIVLSASALGLPRPTLIRMGVNIGLEALIGLVPFLGDLFDAAFKANRRNMSLIDAHTITPKQGRRDTLFVVCLVAGALLFFAFAAAVIFYGISEIAKNLGD